MTAPTLEETQDDDYIAEQAEHRLHAVVPPGVLGQRLDVVLAAVWPQYSRSRLQGWLREGRVRVDDEVDTDARRRTYTGERLELEPGSMPADTVHAPQAIPLDVIFEDDTLLVINKPAGMVVHPGNGVPDRTLLNALLHRLPELAQVPRAGIVHRLDKDTTGLLVVARTLEAQTDLVRQLQARTVSRRYIAVVAGAVRADGVVDAPIGRHPVQRTRMAVSADRQSRLALITSCASACATRLAWNAGWKPDAPTRYAYTWRRSGIRCWVTKPMRHERWQSDFQDRHCTPGNLA
jgi:23S rRNA pseudouridine1911/1915/1917 synthase